MTLNQKIGTFTITYPVAAYLFVAVQIHPEHGVHGYILDSALTS